MKNKIAILVATVFLTVQLLSFQHMAKHGFKEHTHNGKICEINAYFHQSESFDSAANPPVIIHAVSYISLGKIFLASEISVSFFAFTQSPRAPPVTLPA